MDEKQIKALSEKIFELIPQWDREDDTTPESIRAYTDAQPWETINFLMDYIENLES